MGGKTQQLTPTPKLEIKIFNKSTHTYRLHYPGGFVDVPPNTSIPVGDPKGCTVSFEGKEQIWWGLGSISGEVFWWLTHEAHIVDDFSINPDTFCLTVKTDKWQ